MADRRLALLGMMGALIEATLYIFIFLWTPALEGTAGESRRCDAQIPRGLCMSEGSLEALESRSEYLIGTAGMRCCRGRLRGTGWCGTAWCLAPS